MNLPTDAIIRIYSFTGILVMLSEYHSMILLTALLLQVETFVEVLGGGRAYSGGGGAGRLERRAIAARASFTKWRWAWTGRS